MPFRKERKKEIRKRKEERRGERREERRGRRPSRQACVRSRCVEVGMCQDPCARSEKESLPFDLCHLRVYH